MALTVTKDTPRAIRVGRSSPFVTLSGVVAFDNSYVTGGLALTGITNYFRKALTVTFAPASGYTFYWDKVNAKVLVFTQGITTGATGAADSTSGALVVNDAATETVVRAMGSSISTTYQLGPLKQVANAVDLSAVTDVRFFAYGYM